MLFVCRESVIVEAVEKATYAALHANAFCISGYTYIYLIVVGPSEGHQTLTETQMSRAPESFSLGVQKQKGKDVGET